MILCYKVQNNGLHVLLSPKSEGFVPLLRLSKSPEVCVVCGCMGARWRINFRIVYQVLSQKEDILEIGWEEQGGWRWKGEGKRE